MEYPDVPLGASCFLTATTVESVLCGHPGLVTNIKDLFMILPILGSSWVP